MGDGVNVGVMVNVGAIVNVEVTEAAAGGGGSVASDLTEDAPPHAEIKKKAAPESTSIFFSF